MTDPGRSGYAVSAGNSGDTTTATTADVVYWSVAHSPPTTDLATAIAHIRAAIVVLERIAAQ